MPGPRPAALAYRDIDRTCAELSDGASWRRLLGPMVEHADAAVGFVLGDKRSLPPNLMVAAQLGVRMLVQGTPARGSLRGEDARALFTGVAAHTISAIPSLTAAGAGMILATLAHTVGWPVPVGGSQAITDALLADFIAHAGELVLGETVTGPPPGVVLYDTTARALLDIYGPAVPTSYFDLKKG